MKRREKTVSFDALPDDRPRSESQNSRPPELPEHRMDSNESDEEPELGRILLATKQVPPKLFYYYSILSFSIYSYVYI